jgi:hypothetical protein
MAALIEWMKNPAGLQNPMQSQSRPLNLSDFSNGAPDPAKSLPIPYAPAGNLGPLRDDTSAAYGALNPEPVLPRIVQPAAPDQGFVNQYAGAAPTAPTIKPASTLDKVMAALMGFSEGAAGRGPQYVASLRAERERPIREYERQREDYEQRRTRGIELAERRSEREAMQTNRMLELSYEREFKTWLQKNSDRSDEAKERVRQAFITERDSRAARLETEREERRERRQQEVEARHISDQYFALTKNKTLSDEIGRYRAGLTPSLSPAAAALERRVTQLGEVGMGRALSGGGSRGGARRGPTNEAQAALDKFNAARQGVIEAMQRGDAKSAKAYGESMQRLYKSLARYPRDIELATTDPNWPFARMRGQQSAPAALQPQAQGKTITRAEMAALGITEAQAKAEGYTIQ